MRPRVHERILVVDDEENVLHFLSKLLTAEGFEVETAATAGEAIVKAKEVPCELAILDLRLPDGDGIDLLKAMREARPEMQGVVITAYGSIDSAIEAIKAGAYDYVTKPFRAQEILKVVGRALERDRLSKEVQRLRREVERRYSFGSLIGKSRPMQEVFQQIEKVAASKGTVLICGESGTGKELVARAIHYNSDRRDRPLVVIDGGTIPENLQESELFGHVKGAFTGAIAAKRGLLEGADGGTLFLDEVGDLTLASQAKLLRILQDGTIRRVGDTRTVQVDVRILAATNKDLAEEVRWGSFREDLYYRLKVVVICLPPLRERREDIPLLADHFLHKYGQEFGRGTKRLSPGTLDLLMAYPWPGNVRELENAVERAILFSEGETVMERDLPPELRGEGEEIRLAPLGGSLRLEEVIGRIVREMERKVILKALSQTTGNRTEAARLLGISRRALLYKLRRYGIG